MEWRKEFSFPFERVLYTASIVLLIASFYFNSLLLFLCVLFFCLLNVSTRFYLKYITENLKLVNSRQTVRMFVDDEDSVIFQFENVGKFPLFNGEFQFMINNAVECPEADPINAVKTQKTYGFRVNVDHHGGRKVHLKVKGIRRGAAKLQGVRLTVRDWFSIGTVYLTYDPLFRTEVIVYPELRLVYGLERIQTTWQGAKPAQYSLDEDVTSPSGTRSYLPSDPFNRIHWKASAKTGGLQTKVFEKTHGMTWVLLFHISREGMAAAHLEREISCLAYVCKFAVERGIPFELYTNVKSRGKGQIMHLPVGEGRNQLAKALEWLARLNANSVTLPAHRLFSYVDSRHYHNPIMILCNLFHRDDPNGTLQTWKRKGFGLYCVEHREDGSFIVNIAKEKAVS